ncbi:MAG: hypothetical protein ACREIA_26305 [Opitutaceae bacterium]
MMNPQTSPTCPPKEVPPPLPGSTTPPSDDGDETQRETTVDFIFNGKEDGAKGFNGGKMVQHTMPLEGDTRTYVFSLREGPHELRTLAELDVKALLGPCTIAIRHGDTRTLQTGEEMIIIPGSTFTLETTAKAVLYLTSLGDPGLGGGGGRKNSNL